MRLLCLQQSCPSLHTEAFLSVHIRGDHSGFIPLVAPDAVLPKLPGTVISIYCRSSSICFGTGSVGDCWAEWTANSVS
jgi:hypothetical protein